MEKLLFSLPKKVILLAFLSFFIFQHNSFSQCVIANPVQEFCASDHKTVADLEVTTGINVVWFDALTGGNQYAETTPIVDGNSYYALDLDPSCTDPTRVEVTVIIYGEPPTNVDVFVGKCASEQSTINDLSADGIDIKWFDAQTGGNELPTSTELQDGQTYWVQQTENGCTSERLPTTVSLIDPPTPTLQSVQSFCSTQNATVANLEANESNIVWYSSETSTTPLSTFTPLINGEDYWASQIVFPCESTVRIQTTVVIDTVSDAGTDGSYSECEINLTTTNLFSLLGGTPDDTGVWSGPSTLSGGYLGTFDPSINTEGTYTYTVASSLGVCPDQTANVDVIIEVVPPPSGSTTQTFCEIENATVGDLSPSGTGINWYNSDTSTTPLATTEALVDGAIYYATQTNVAGCESVLRLVVSASIIVELPPTTSENTQTFCEIENATISNLSIVGNNIQWYDSETSTTPLDTSEVLVNGEDYWATQNTTSNCESALRLVVTAEIISTPPPTTSAVNQSFCMNDFTPDSPTISDLAISGEGIQWYDTETSTTPLNTTDILIDGQTYWATQTDASGCESATRLSITATVTNTPIATTSNVSQTFCAANNPTIADIEVTGDAIIWFDTETSTTPLTTSDALVNSEDYWALNTDGTNGCESSARLQIISTITDVPAPIIEDTTQSFCEVSNPTIADLVSQDTVVWFASETATTTLNGTDLLTNNTVYWASAVNAIGCNSSVRIAVTVILNDPGTPVLDNLGDEFCKINNPTLEDLNSRVSPVNNGSITWYANYPNGTPLSLSEYLIDRETYYAVETDSNGCESVTPLDVTVDLEACDEYDIVTYDGFSPNGDGVNDTFKIENLRILYPDFKVEFFNRWGNSVYTADANREDWNGRLKGDGEYATAGVYYFIIYFNKDNRKPLQDRLYLSR